MEVHFDEWQTTDSGPIPEIWIKGNGEKGCEII